MSTIEVKASPCAAALNKLCGPAQKTGQTQCFKCERINAKSLEAAGCYDSHGKCQRSKPDCLSKFCGVPDPVPPGSKDCFNSIGMQGYCGRDFPQCHAKPLVDGPQFHIRDLTCGTSDINAPFRDPVTGYYHVFYQDLLMTNKPISKTGKGPHRGSHESFHFLARVSCLN